MKFRRVFFGTAVAVFAFAGSVQAAVLSLTGPGTAGTLTANFDLTAETGLLNNGTQAITIFNTATPGGLQLTGSASDIRFEFLGFEANFANTFEFPSTTTVFDGSTPLNTISTALAVPTGLLDFVFTTTGIGGSATNGGPFGGSLSIAFADLGDGSFIALFGDGLGDNDHDDFAVKISAVPLPPAIWLLLSAILGLVSFGRQRRKRLQAA